MPTNPDHLDTLPNGAIVGPTNRTPVERIVDEAGVRADLAHSLIILVRGSVPLVALSSTPTGGL